MQRPSDVVLLIEADPDLADLFRLLLEHLGCVVQTVADPAAVAALAMESPALAVVDARGAADGWALCQQVQRVISRPVIGLLPVAEPVPPLPNLYSLPLPVSPRALRDLVHRLLLAPAN